MDDKRHPRPRCRVQVLIQALLALLALAAPGTRAAGKPIVGPRATSTAHQPSLERTVPGAPGTGGAMPQVNATATRPGQPALINDPAHQVHGTIEGASPHWGGFIGALEQHVRATLERVAEDRPHRAMAKRWAAPLGAPTAPGADAPADPAGPRANALPEGDSSLPTRLWFGPASPNPAPGPVGFRLDLPFSARVKFSVFDVAGRVVHEDAGVRGAGRHTITWDGRDRLGRIGHAGIYFARMEVDGRPIGTRRVVFLR